MISKSYLSDLYIVFSLPSNFLSKGYTSHRSNLPNLSETFPCTYSTNPQKKIVAKKSQEKVPSVLDDAFP